MRITNAAHTSAAVNQATASTAALRTGPRLGQHQRREDAEREPGIDISRNSYLGGGARAGSRVRPRQAKRPSRSLRSLRNADPESGALSRPVIDTGLAAVSPRDSPDDGEPQSCASYS